MLKQEGGRRIENIAQIFREKGATAPEKAMTRVALGLSSRFEDAMSGPLGRSGIFVNVADNKYYLDELRLQEIFARARSLPSQHKGFANRKKKSILDFDIDALFNALDAQRVSRGLRWSEVAKEMWLMAGDLNRSRSSDHPLSPSTIVNMSRHGNTTCQQALIFLQWLERAPESFLTRVPKERRGTPIRSESSDRRPRWNLVGLYDAIDTRRQEERMTWQEAAGAIGCSPSQLTGLRTARYATSMKLAMRIVQWLDRPAADFIYLAKW